jgi:phosphohistidine phosphatase
MELYFLRHGVAADAGPAGTGDVGRPLTKEGVTKMKAESRGLRRLGIEPDALLSSPLARAHQTAEIVARELAVELQLADALAPGCTAERLLELLSQHRDAERVIVVGHEPDFSTMIGELTGGSRVLLKKGGLGRVDLEAMQKGGGTLVWLLPPLALRAAGG